MHIIISISSSSSSIIVIISSSSSSMFIITVTDTGSGRSEWSTFALVFFMRRLATAPGAGLRGLP